MGLSDIEMGFAEFTTNLILKVFDGLVAANLSQTEAFAQLVQSLSKSLSAYVNDTKDDISGAEILKFLSTVLPKDPGTGQPKQITNGTTLTKDDLTPLNNALALPATDGGLSTTAGSTQVTNNQVTTTTALDDPAVGLILDAVARRLAANKYSLLQEMVKQGMLRLVVNQGLIETGLTYRTFTSSYYVSNQSTYDSKQFNFAAQAQTGSALARWVKASASANYTSVSVTATNASQQDYTGTSVNIFGRVRIEFKTDYLPLGA